MVLPLWGELQKAQDDTETIEEAIIRIVQDHNNDPTAHLADGQSLEQHKTQEVIDHPLGSILGDKFTNKDFILMPSFESLDRYVASIGSGVVSLGSVELLTTATSNNMRYLVAGGQSSPAVYSPTKRTTFQFSGILDGRNNTVIYVGAGDNILNGNAPFAGFKVLNGALYACQNVIGEEDYLEYTDLIEGVDVDEQHLYRVEVVPDESKMYFYVDGQLLSEMAIYETFDNSLNLFSINLKTTNSTAKKIWVGGIYLSLGFNY